MVQIGKILFEKSSALWEDDETFNRILLKSNELYLNNLLKYRGYLYMNQIYEHLGIAWDANCRNSCIKYDKNKFLALKLDSKRNNEFLVTILISNKEEEL